MSNSHMSHALKGREFCANINAETLEISAFQSGNLVIETRTGGFYSNFVFSPQIIEVNNLDQPSFQPKLAEVLALRGPGGKAALPRDWDPEAGDPNEDIRL